MNSSTQVAAKPDSVDIPERPARWVIIGALMLLALFVGGAIAVEPGEAPTPLVIALIVILVLVPPLYFSLAAKRVTIESGLIILTYRTLIPWRRKLCKASEVEAVRIRVREQTRATLYELEIILKRGKSKRIASTQREGFLDQTRQELAAFLDVTVANSLE